jgi:hypothetical protein
MPIFPASSHGPKNGAWRVGDQFVLAPNSTVNDTLCQKQSLAPRLNFQAHSAPLEARFVQNYSAMLVNFHGSSNRDVPTGYKMVSVPFTTKPQKQGGGEVELMGYEPVAAPDSQSAYEDVWWNEDITTCTATNCFRPAGMIVREGKTVDNKGTEIVFVSSDSSTEGEVFVLMKS